MGHGGKRDGWTGSPMLVWFSCPLPRLGLSCEGGWWLAWSRHAAPAQPSLGV